MEGERGVERGSYIWGRSVHNIRIERAWADMTAGFGGKWKTFFQELEQFCGLEVDRPEHIWLLHFLFLDAINEDALQWAESWNAHTLQIRGSRNQSPREMFLFGMVESGLRGFGYQSPEVLDEVVDDPGAYGIDWEAVDDDQIFAHHLANNPSNSHDATQPFSNAPPDRLSHVEVNSPSCPLVPERLEFLHRELNDFYATVGGSRSMAFRRSIWNHALAICNDMSRW
ncbi:hypothetical protein BD410DRAFT_734694 [Rickenella mellea]|uniref:Integrase core domain-containing protein n=1 Tax=Rickenella mellea TaxID=50990 RepID=A0A4Y7PHR9_9AGAM|nr:hypothetical protein BD410DRAFT_734694 [Rickenella mellea]